MGAVPLPYAGYDLSPAVLRAAVARARRLGWVTVAREAGKKEAQRMAAIDRAIEAERAGLPHYVADRHQSRADGCEIGAALLNYAARVVWAEVQK